MMDVNLRQYFERPNNLHSLDEFERNLANLLQDPWLTAGKKEKLQALVNSVKPHEKIEHLKQGFNLEDFKAIDSFVTACFQIVRARS